MPEWYEAIAVWQLAIPTVLGIFMFIITKSMHDSQKERNKTDALFKVFSLLSSHEIRKARTTIHHHNIDRTQPLSKETINEIPDEIDLVLASFDQVCILVLKGKVDYELFFELYGQMVVRDFMRLKNIIDEKQKPNPKTLKHFTDLKNEFEGRTDLGEVKLY